MFTIIDEIPYLQHLHAEEINESYIQQKLKKAFRKKQTTIPKGSCISNTLEGI